MPQCLAPCSLLGPGPPRFLLHLSILRISTVFFVLPISSVSCMFCGFSGRRSRTSRIEDARALTERTIGGTIGNERSPQENLWSVRVHPPIPEKKCLGRRQSLVISHFNWEPDTIVLPQTPTCFILDVQKNPIEHKMKIDNNLINTIPASS